MKFSRPFSTFSALFKEAATKATKAAKPKAVKDTKPAKVTPYKQTKEDRTKYGKLNKGETARLFETEGDSVTLDRVRLLRRYIQYNANRDRLPPYNAWVKATFKESPPGTTMPDVAKQYSQKSDAEKAEISREYSYDADETNVYDKYDYKSIKYPKLSGLNVYLGERLKDQTQVESKLKDVLADWAGLSDTKKKHYNDTAKKTNADNVVRLQNIFREVKKLHEQEKLEKL